MRKFENKTKQTWVELVASGKNPKKAAEMVYPNLPKNYAHTNARKWMQHEDVKQAIREILEQENGTQLHNVINGIGKDLQATKEVVYNNKGDIVEIKDNEMRSKAQEKILRLYQATGYESKGQVNDNRTQVINLGHEDVKRLEETLDKLQQIKFNDNEPVQNGEIN